MTLTEMKARYLKAKAAYYNAAPVMSDAQFDKLEDAIKAQDPKWAELRKTGVKTADKKTEVRLTHFMPSLNKAYPDAIGAWFAKNRCTTYLGMPKLDGGSLQLTYRNGKPVQLVTRGDGVHGGDISFLIPHLTLPAVRKNVTAVFRCEALMKRHIFQKYWASKFDNPRNMVNGMLNRRTPHPALKQVDVVILGAFGMTLTEGLKLADSIGLRTVDLVKYSYRDATPGRLSEWLAALKAKTNYYEVDGLVIAPEHFELTYRSSDKPKGIVAFKFNDEANAAEARVERIIWQVSKHGRIIPKIEIEPTKMDGVTVTYCTVHNAQWMVERKIGPGAVVKVLRSGGVIPKIVGVVKAGRFQPPAVAYTEQGVHFMVADEDEATTKTMVVKRIVSFLTHLGIEFAAAKTVARLYDMGLDSSTAYLRILGNRVRFFKIANTAGLGPKQSEVLWKQLQALLDGPVSYRTMMVASGVFGVGIGDRKLKMIEEAGIRLGALPRIYEADPRMAKLMTVPGFAASSVQMIAKGMKTWIKFAAVVEQAGIALDSKLPKPAKSVRGGKCSGMRVSFTGYRSADEEAAVAAAGGEVVPFGSRTTHLLTRPGGKASSKVEKAQEKGIKVTNFKAILG